MYELRYLVVKLLTVGMMSRSHTMVASVSDPRCCLLSLLRADTYEKVVE